MSGMPKQCSCICLRNPASWCASPEVGTRQGLPGTRPTVHEAKVRDESPPCSVSDRILQIMEPKRLTPERKERDSYSIHGSVHDAMHGWLVQPNPPALAKAQAAFAASCLSNQLLTWYEQALSASATC